MYFSLYNIYLVEELNVCLCFDVSKSRYYGNLLTITYKNQQDALSFETCRVV